MPKIGDKVLLGENETHPNEVRTISDIAFHEEHGCTYYYFDGKTRESEEGWEDCSFTVIEEVSPLHNLHTDYAKRVLSVIERALHDLDELSIVDALIIANTLRRERAMLVKGNAAYMEASAILYVGEDWLKEA